MFDQEYLNDDEALAYDQDEIDNEARSVDWDAWTNQHLIELWEAGRPVMVTIQNEIEEPF